MSGPIGIIAGQGRLPIITAAGVHAAGRRVACVGLTDQYVDGLPGCCDEFAGAGMIRLNRWIRLLKGWGVSEAVMVGRVSKASMYTPWRAVRQLPDWRAARLWYRVLRHDKRPSTVLGAVTRELAGCGITLIDSTRYISDHLATPGAMTGRPPTAAVRADIAFGWPLLMRIVDLDIGQAIAVKERDVIAVEAMEGTDAMIERAGRLCRSGGWTLLKGVRADKDRRFDVPTIGVETIARLKAAGAAAVAVASGGVILIDKPEVIRAAEGAGVAMMGV